MMQLDQTKAAAGLRLEKIMSRVYFDTKGLKPDDGQPDRS